MRKKRVVPFVLVLVLLFSLKPLINEVHATTYEQLKEAQEELHTSKEELEDVEEDLSGLTTTQRALKKTLSKLQEELQAVVDELTELEGKLQLKEEEIKVTLGTLEKAETKENEQYEAMKSRIKFIYERGDVAYIDLFLSARTFSDFLNKADYVEKLSEYDRDMLVSYQETVEEIKEVKTQLEEEEAQLLALHTEVENKQEEVVNLVEEASKNVSSQQNVIDATALEKVAIENEVKAKEETVSELRKQYEAELALSELAQNSYKRDISEVTFVEGDLKILASIIYCEAGGEPYAGQLAVGAVAINRLLSSRYPDTLVGVIYQPYQFSPVLSGRMEIALTQNKATQSCYNAATEAMSGVTNVDGCLYFRTPIEGVIPKYVIGGHIFY